MNIIGQRKIQIFIILIGNAVPLAGFVLWQWNTFQIIFLYWMESFVVGIFSLLEVWILEEQGDQIDNGMPPPLVLVFMLVYFSILFLYFAGVCRVLGAKDFENQLDVFKPFIPQIIIFAVAFLISHSIRFWQFTIRAKKKELSTLIHFSNPFLRLVVVHLLLVTGMFWIYYKHASLIFFAVMSLAKSLIDYGFYAWHEAHIPPVIKDREFFGM